jgi:SAM-dependent methyltransferase
MGGAHHRAGIFLLSMATLLLELSWTRVLSVSLWYHFGFLVISTALLGFGIAGVVLALWGWLRERADLDTTLAALSLAFGASALVSFRLTQAIPFDPFSLLADRRQLLFMPLYYVLVATPFFFSGLAIALLFSRVSKKVNVLYAFDLLGAGLGCAAVALVLPAAGGSGSVVVAAALGLVTAAAFGIRQARPLAVSGLVLGGLALGLLPWAESALPISVTPNKRPYATTPLLTRWNTFSRIDLLERRVSSDPGALLTRRFIFDAGTAATGIADLRPDVSAYLAAHTDDADYESSVAYLGKRGLRVLDIGSGAGQEVLDALHEGAASVTAVEINGIINDVLRDDPDGFWGGLFRRPEVRLVTEEGRSYVRRVKDTYDVIVSSHTISNAAVASGAMSLAENYVLTREAFDDYLDRLMPDGVIYFTRPEAQLPRLFATIREVMDARGIADPPRHVFAYRTVPGAGSGETRKSFVSVFLFKKSPFTDDELHRIDAAVTHPSDPADLEPETMEILYSPLNPDGGGLYREILSTTDVAALFKAQPFQIEPATDDRPFFNQHTRWSSLGWGTVRDLLTQGKQARMALEDRPVAEISLLTILVESVVVAAVLILLPLVRFVRTGADVAGRGRILVYFAALGLGFIMIEIALLQRFTLFLGQPAYTLAAILASLLVFTGIGSALAGRFARDPRRALLIVVPGVPFMLAITAVATPWVFDTALGWPFGARVVVAVILLAPLGIVLGMPFPIGLRWISDEASALVPWAWGVNGFFTVIGSVLSMILGMALGFRAVLALAAVCYLLAWSATLLRPVRKVGVAPALSPPIPWP